MPLPTQYWPQPITDLVSTVQAAGHELHVDVCVDAYDKIYEVRISVPKDTIDRAKTTAAGR